MAKNASVVPLDTIFGSLNETKIKTMIKGKKAPCDFSSILSLLCSKLGEEGQTQANNLAALLKGFSGNPIQVEGQKLISNLVGETACLVTQALNQAQDKDIKGILEKIRQEIIKISHLHLNLQGLQGTINLLAWLSATLSQDPTEGINGSENPTEFNLNSLKFILHHLEQIEAQVQASSSDKEAPQMIHSDAIKQRLNEANQPPESQTKTPAESSKHPDFKTNLSQQVEAQTQTTSELTTSSKEDLQMVHSDVIKQKLSKSNQIPESQTKTPAESSKHPDFKALLKTTFPQEKEMASVKNIPIYNKTRAETEILTLGTNKKSNATSKTSSKKQDLKLDKNSEKITFNLSINKTNPSVVKASRVSTPSQSLMDKDVMNQIMKELRVQLETGQKEATIQLQPPTLGKLHIKVGIDNGVLNIHFLANQYSAKEIIENNLNLLKQALTQQGLQLGEFSVALGGEQTSDSKYKQGQNRSGKDLERRENISEIKSVTERKYYSVSEIDFWA